jgi:hypothetical protein
MPSPTLPRERHLQLWLPIPERPPPSAGQFVLERWLCSFLAPAPASVLAVQNHGCSTCRMGPSNELEQLHTAHDDAMKSWSVHAVYQCRVCKARWVHIRERGPGDRGDYWHPQQ